METATTQLEYNTKLSKLCQISLKKNGAIKYQQNYRGTGKQAHRRQIYITFSSGAKLDIWFDTKSVGFGGVVMRDGKGPIVRSIAYEQKTEEQMCAEITSALKIWAGV